MAQARALEQAGIPFVTTFGLIVPGVPPRPVAKQSSPPVLLTRVEAEAKRRPEGGQQRSESMARAAARPDLKTPPKAKPEAKQKARPKVEPKGEAEQVKAKAAARASELKQRLLAKCPWKHRK